MKTEEDRNVDTLYHLNKLVNTEAYDQMDELFAKNYIDHNPSWNIQSLSDLKKIIADSHRSFDIKNIIEEAIASGDKVFIRVNNKGRHISTAFGVPPTGKETSMLTFEIYRFENGQIAERWVLSDVIGLMQQLGVQLPF